MIKLSRLSKSYHQRRRAVINVLKDVSFCCKPGQITGLLGINGAGKTTTLRILSTALSVGGGNAEVAGFDVSTAPHEVRRRLGFLSASTRLHGRLTAREELTCYGRYFQLPSAELQSRITTVLERMEMGHCADRRLDSLSMGQNQRVNIARTLLHDPPVLILDEPTTGLDVISARVFLDVMLECKEQGKTILFSTHNMGDAAQLCDHLAILDSGQIVASGTPEMIMQSHGTADLETAFLRTINSGTLA